jgi:hypothetical protein
MTHVQSDQFKNLSPFAGNGRYPKHISQAYIPQQYEVNDN